MLNEDELQIPERFVSAMAAWAKTCPENARRCSLQVVKQGTSPIFCLLRVGLPRPVTKEVLDYGKVQLGRQELTLEEFVTQLESLTRTGILHTVVGDLQFNLEHSTPHQTFEPSGSEYHEWPGYLYQIGASQQSWVAQEPLVGRGLPPFFDLKDVVRSWIGLRISDNDGRYRRFLLFVPDFTARFEQMSFAEGRLRVRNRFFANSGLTVSVLASDGNTVFRKTKPLRKTLTFNMMSNPTSLRVFITDESGHTHDSFAEEQAWASRARVIFAGARYSEASMQMIRRGESDTVEFKEFIRLDDKKKSADIVKAVISFANTSGGTIFIGVSDDADIEGVDSHVPHKQTMEAFQADYLIGIRRLLQQKLNRIPAIDTHVERIGDKTVFLIRVQEGSTKPYFNVQTREIFVRRGASDIRPDPDTEMRDMFGRTGADFGPFTWSQ